AIRFVILLLLIAGFVVAGHDWTRRLVMSFSLGGSGTTTATLDAWINPPTYTGLAPIYLPRGDQSVPIDAPEGSAVAVRVHGQSQPGVSLLPSRGLSGSVRGQGDDYSADTKLVGDAHLSVTAGGEVLGSWQIHAIPDRPPSITFAAKPSRTERDSVKF